MDDEEGRKYLAHYMIEAWRRRGGDSFMPATIRRESFSESPEITFHTANGDFRFGFGKTPFNTADADLLISDKWRMFQTLGNALPLPFTERIGKRDVRGDAEIAAGIVAKTEDPGHPFSFPLIVKPSEGSLSRHVYIARDEQELVHALRENRSDTSYGDGVLIQQFLGDEQGLFTEMRAICLDGRTQIAFDRTTDQDIPAGVLTDPAQWPGVRLRENLDIVVLAQIDVIAEYLYENYGVSYVTFDMKRDRAGRVWIVEGNVAAMGLDVMERDLMNGRRIVPGLAEKMLDKVVAAGLTPEKEPANASRGAEPEFS
ncbi:MAG: hypothetical protein H6858_01050 [Rhodospirillales bacterium]|nr:hypothetical protein [Rhodospirillales bacterium]